MEDDKATPASWIEDGEPTTEPVTTETPAAVETAEVVEAVEVKADTTEAPAAVTADDVVQTFIDAKTGDDTFQIPDNVMVPRTVDGETTYVSLQEMMAGATDTQSAADILTEVHKERSEFGRQKAAHERKVLADTARAEFVAEEAAKIKGALSDPEKARELEQHLHLMQTNTEYRALHDRDWSNREVAIERDALKQDNDDRIVREASVKVNGWITSLSGQFPGVDIGRVSSQYGQELSAGRAAIDESYVKAIFESEAAYLATATRPFETQMAELTAKIDTLMGSQNAEKQNETTQHAVARANTVPVVTGSGAPATTTAPLTKFGPNELADRVQDWSNVR